MRVDTTCIDELLIDIVVRVLEVEYTQGILVEAVEIGVRSLLDNRQYFFTEVLVGVDHTHIRILSHSLFYDSEIQSLIST